MKQMFRDGRTDSVIGWLSKLRWNNIIEMVEMTGKLDE
jgi:cell division inhibitor SulA